MEQLGGQAIFLGVADLQLKRGETIETPPPSSADMWTRSPSSRRPGRFFGSPGHTVPVFNGLTTFDHPIEALSDLMTLKERFGQLRRHVRHLGVATTSATR